MSIGTFFKALLPVASSTASDLDSKIKAIQDKANADIAAAKTADAKNKTSASVLAKRKNWVKFQHDYEAYLASGGVTPANPSSPSGPSGASGPTA